MIIISHRGFWDSIDEKNTEKAFNRSFKFGFGTETDVRDCAGKLVISHDMPLGGEMSLSHYISLFADNDLLIALNIKSDGMSDLISQKMSKYNKKKWFVFDMSIPDMKAHIDCGNPVFSRMSEVESQPIWLDYSEGVWLDSFEYEWYDLNLIKDLISKGKRVCIVSSELHGREYTDLWNMLLPLAGEENLILCTDHPKKADFFFKTGGI